MRWTVRGTNGHDGHRRTACNECDSRQVACHTVHTVHTPSAASHVCSSPSPCLLLPPSLIPFSSVTRVLAIALAPSCSIMKQSMEQSSAALTASKPQHPAWLQHEINKAQLRRQQAEQHEQQQQLKHQRVTQQALNTRNLIRHSHSPPSQPPAINFIDNHRPVTCTPHGRPQPGRGERSRPKWAMTAAEEEKEMEAECEELVDFVEELNYDQWMREMEERGAKPAEEEKESENEQKGEKLLQKQDLIETLGSEPRQEADSEWDDSLPRPPTGLRPATQSIQPRPLTSNSRPHTARPATSPQVTTDNTETFVATLLHSSTAIRNIHSSHSLRALISSAHNSRPQHPNTATVPVNSVSVAIAAPLVSVVATRDALHGKINPSLLPYLHRHPAV